MSTSISRLARTLSPGNVTGALDRSLARLSANQPEDVEVQRLRWFWLDGVFATISSSFYGSFVALFAVAYGATNAQIGQLTAVASLCGLIALVPGAQAIKLLGGRRKAVVLGSGMIARVALLGWVLLPFLLRNPGAAILAIIAVNAVITFANNFANPAWTAIVADIVPREIRGRFFSHRNIGANLPALLVVPLAGWLIQIGNRPGAPFAGYQLVFALAFASGVVATFAYSRINDPAPSDQGRQRQRLGEVSQIIRSAPGFLSLVAVTLIWNLGAQMTGPFLNVYLVSNLGATTAMVGWTSAASTLAALLTQRWLGRWVDRRGNIWVQGALSFTIVGIPLAWMVATAPWHVLIINAIAGILWTGHALASFNLLLDLAPEKARAEANAIFQLVIAGSATIAPMVSGYLADALGFKPMFALSAAMRVVGALAFVWWVARPASRGAHGSHLPADRTD
ncbi:MAG: MFS transporter [Chloroflexi bacterium]|nr:MFS transporter [Chloroflexota bacterium]